MLWLCIAGFLLFLVVFFKNAWICDDAYLNFRAVEQLFAGNGPNWNPHERVQVYTSPLWFWMLAVARLISADPFFFTIILSFVLVLLLSFFLYRQLSLFQAAVAFFLLLGSNAFMDFSTSGLENILAALLLTVALIGTHKAIETAKKPQAKSNWLPMLAIAILPVCRHDLLLFAAPLAFILLKYTGHNRTEALKRTLLLMSPLLLWSLFSFVYYGVLFPNTAYAKIFTGIARSSLMAQGLQYCLVTLQQDPITMIVMLLAMVQAFRLKDPPGRALAVALLLNFAYIIWVGGDFMRGRFFTAAFISAVIYIVLHLEKPGSSWCSAGLCQGAVLVYFVYIFLFPFTPVNTGLSYTNFNLNHGIADERGYYFDVCSLSAYLNTEPDKIFPDFEWSHIGRQISQSDVNYLENDFNGMLGYWAGTDKIIIDRLALADPFLARLPVADPQKWRIGHFKRQVPDKYRQSIEKRQNLFPEGQMQKLYELVSKAVRHKNLWSAERLSAMVRLNLGLY
jgi:arabinofuranosyltransferase